MFELSLLFKKNSHPRRTWLRKISIFFYLRALTAIMMLHMVPLAFSSSSAFLRFDFFFNYSHENPRILTAEQEKNLEVFDLRILTVSMMLCMVPPVFPRNIAPFWKKNQIFQLLHEILYFGRDRKISYEKASQIRVTL